MHVAIRTLPPTLVVVVTLLGLVFGAIACADGTLPPHGAGDPANPTAPEGPVAAPATIGSSPPPEPSASAMPGMDHAHMHHHHGGAMAPDGSTP